jgi:hypothetical protein
MSQGAILQYSATVHRHDVMTLVRDTGERVHAEVTDFSNQTDPDELPAGLRSPRVRMRRGRESVFLQFFERSNEAGSPNPVATPVAGPDGNNEPYRYIVMDMNSLELALEIAYAFAHRWPCVFAYVGTQLNDQQLVENERVFRKSRAT